MACSRVSSARPRVLCSDRIAAAAADARHTFATTKRQNKVSKESVLCGSDNIGVKGKTIIEAGAVIRGDLSTIELGSYCLIGRHAVIRPAEQKFQGRIAYIPMTIGDHVMIEENSIVEAAAIGDCTHIGKNVQVVSKERDSSRLRVLRSCASVPIHCMSLLAQLTLLLLMLLSSLLCHAGRRLSSLRVRPLCVGSPLHRVSLLLPA